MKKKYMCERSITVTRLEDLLQDAMVGIEMNFRSSQNALQYTALEQSSRLFHVWFSGGERSAQ